MNRKRSLYNVNFAASTVSIPSFKYTSIPKHQLEPKTCRLLCGQRFDPKAIIMPDERPLQICLNCLPLVRRVAAALAAVGVTYRGRRLIKRIRNRRVTLEAAFRLGADYVTLRHIIGWSRQDRSGR